MPIQPKNSGIIFSSFCQVFDVLETRRRLAHSYGTVTFRFISIWRQNVTRSDNSSNIGTMTTAARDGCPLVA
eukprot:196603-Amorphochlora_amoeboformis.AAC.2